MKTSGLGMVARWLAVVLLLLASPGLSTGLSRGADTQSLPSKIKAAFKQVAAEPAKSTVQVYCDRYRAALGVVVDKDGYIVTKASELKGKIECQVTGGKKVAATLVGSDPALDLAVLKIDATDLPVIAWSEADAPPVGSWLISPGIEGEPVGIGVLSVGPRKIPAPSGALGISLAKIDEPAQIEDVMPDSAAEKAGLEAGDVIRKVNGKDIKGSQMLVETIRSLLPGDKVELVIERDGAEQTITATLGSRSQLFHGDRAEFQNSLGGNLSERRAGFASVIQHDSILRPSECGGPIVDLDGKAIGLNIARAGRVESFALPAALVRETVKKLLETHHTSTPVTATPEKPAPVER